MKISEIIRGLMSVIIFFSFMILFKELLSSDYETSFSNDFILIGILIILGAYILRFRFNYYYSKSNTIKILRKAKLANLKDTFNFFLLNTFILAVIVLYVSTESSNNNNFITNFNLIKNSNLFIIGYLIILIVGGIDIFLYKRIERVNGVLEINGNLDKSFRISPKSSATILRNEIQFMEDIEGENKIIFSLKGIQITGTNYEKIKTYLLLNGISSIITEIK